MERRECEAKLSFVCSPLAVKELDALVVKEGFRSRAELLRFWLENALYKQRIHPAVLDEIEKHHDLLGTPRLRRRPTYQRRFLPREEMTTRGAGPMPPPGQAANAQDSSGATISPADGPPVG